MYSGTNCKECEEVISLWLARLADSDSEPFVIKHMADFDLTYFLGILDLAVPNMDLRVGLFTTYYI